MIDWVKALPWIACVVLALMVAGVANAYLHERDEYTAYRTLVESLGKKAAEDKARIEKVYADNFEKVKAKYEESIPTIRANAVAAYRLRYPDTGSCPVPGTGPSIKMDDGASEELLVAPKFIQDCTEDAAKLTAHIERCTLNKCPIKE